jgi:hypothetical protein
MMTGVITLDFGGNLEDKPPGAASAQAGAVGDADVSDRIAA